jgi:hypothetical protein
MTCGCLILSVSSSARLAAAEPRHVLPVVEKARWCRSPLTDLRISTTKHCSGRVVQKSPFASFSGPSIFDFFDSIGQNLTSRANQALVRFAVEKPLFDGIARQLQDSELQTNARRLKVVQRWLGSWRRTQPRSPAERLTRTGLRIGLKKTKWIRAVSIASAEHDPAYEPLEILSVRRA